MKKLLGIVVLCLLLSNSSYSDEKYFNDFKQWLILNNHTEYLKISNDDHDTTFGYGTEKN